MLKQPDAVIIFIVLAAVIGIFILSSSNASPLLIAAMTMFFGALFGVRLRKTRSAARNADTDREKAGQENTGAATGDESAPAKAKSESAQQAGGTPSSSTTMTAVRPKSSGEASAASQVEMLKNLVSSVSEGITFKDAQGRYLSANAAFAQMLGSRPSEIVGRDDAGVFGLLTAKSLLASDDVAAAEGKVSTTLEVPLPSGPRFFEITKSSVNNDDDGLEGIVAVWRDVTEQALYRIRREKAMSETIMAFT